MTAMRTSPDAAFQTEQIAVALSALEQAGIDVAFLLGTIVGDISAIERLSGELVKRASDYRTASAGRERSRASKSRSARGTEDASQTMGLVRGGGQMAPALIGYLIALMVEACVHAQAVPPSSLAELIRIHVGADTFGAQQFKAPGAFDKAARFRLAWPEASQDEIARHAGVSRTLVSGWIKDGSLDRAAARIGRVHGAADLIRSTTPRA